MSRSYDPETLLIGVIGRPHGLHGETSLRPYGGSSDLSGVPALLLEQQGKRVQWGIRSLRRTREGWLVRLDGVESREAADALTNASVLVSRRSLPPLGPGEFYVEDLIGCHVQTEKGSPLGVVEGVFWNGAHDVMTVGGGAAVTSAVEGAAEPGAVEPVLIPVVPNFMRSVDPVARQVVVAWESDA